MPVGVQEIQHTEIVAEKDNGSAGVSALTQESNVLSQEELEIRRDIVRVRLMTRNIPEHEIKAIIEKKEPYEMAFSGINLPTWDADKEVFMVLAIRDQFVTKRLSK